MLDKMFVCPSWGTCSQQMFLKCCMTEGCIKKAQFDSGKSCRGPRKENEYAGCHCVSHQQAMTNEGSFLHVRMMSMRGGSRGLWWE